MRYGVAIINDVGHPFVQGFLTPETGNISVRGEYYYPIEAKGSFKYTGLPFMVVETIINSLLLK
ncbi:Uncharacterised protein [Actinobacillus equuli]|nr:Uncharacterised protein [Actinobacillus equuli]